MENLTSSKNSDMESIFPKVYYSKVNQVTAAMLVSHGGSCLGASCCCYSSCFWGLELLSGKDFHDVMNTSYIDEHLPSLVQSWDAWSSSGKGGDAKEIFGFLATDPAFAFAKHVSLHVESRTVIKSVGKLAEEVLPALELFAKYTSLSVATVTIKNNRNATKLEKGTGSSQEEHQGKSFAILHPAENVYGVIDTHRHYDMDGSELGSLFYRCQSTDEVATFLFSPDGLVEKLQCDCCQVEVEVTVACNIKQIVSANCKFALMRSVAALYPDLMLPGDFLYNEYGGDFLRQLCSAGAKYYNCQKYMYHGCPGPGLAGAGHHSARRDHLGPGPAVTKPGQGQSGAG